jgi:hypothetical protein
MKNDQLHTSPSLHGLFRIVHSSTVTDHQTTAANSSELSSGQLVAVLINERFSEERHDVDENVVMNWWQFFKEFSGKRLDILGVDLQCGKQ